MTHRERVALALDHRDTDRVPIAMVCSGINAPAYRALSGLLRHERGLTVEAYLDPLLDITAAGPRFRGPESAPGSDIWGVIRAPMSYGDGSYDEIRRHPLSDAQTVDDILAYRCPSPDWFDYDSLRDDIAHANAGEERCIMLSGGNPYETAWYMRGFERMFEDLVLRPEIARAILSRVTTFFVEFTRRQLEGAQGMADLVFTADDIGAQNGLLMSLGMWEEFIKPCHVLLNQTIHEFGARVIYHSDGAVMAAAPGLIDMGIDVLQALQFDARGMDAAVLKDCYGDRLCFEGGVSVQSTLPFGRPDDVRKEVEERIRVLGRDGGYILGPSHAIQAGTPPANIMAMFDAAAAPRRSS